MAYLKQTEKTNNFLEVLVRDHRRYMPIMEYLDNLTQQESELTWQERELIALEVSRANGAEFCVGIHSGVLRAFEYHEIGIREDAMQPVLVFVNKLVKASRHITKEDVEAVKKGGWSDQTVEDIIGLVSAITIYDILANGFGFKASLPEEVFEEMGKGTIAAGGFVAQFQSFIE